MRKACSTAERSKSVDKYEIELGRYKTRIFALLATEASGLPESKAKSAQIATIGVLLKSGVTASTTDAERARPRKSCTKHLTAFVMPLKFLAEDGHQQIQCGLKYLILPICSKFLKIGFSS